MTPPTTDPKSSPAFASFPLFRTIRWKLIVSSLLAISIPLVILGVVLANLLWDYYTQNMSRELKAKSFIIADAAAPILSPETEDNPKALERMVRQWGQYSDVRVTIADANGIIKASVTPEDVNTLVTEERRPGMLLALQGEPTSTVWKNPQYGNQDTMYANAPVKDGDRIVGAVRVAYTLTEIQNNIARVRITLQSSFALYAVLIIFLTVRLATSIVRPVEEITRSAQRIGAGDLEHRVEVKGTDEITHLGATLNQMTQRLLQLEGLRRQYVSNVSHELRTPLAAIRGMAETMMEHGNTDPTLRARYLPRIISQTERLARLASQLLDLAQIESGNLVENFGPTSIHAVIEDAVHVCAEGARQNQVRIDMEVAENLPEITADRDRLTQVFLNLIDNGVRHTPAGGNVRVAAHQRDQSLVITIADTGEGMPPEHLPHIFDRFYRVEQARTRRTGGTGLGLAIVHQILEAHQSSIHVRSEVGKGTEFEIVLPLKPEKPGGKPSPSPEAVPAGT
ncbi:MAG: ATP-binding protein [Armatimonadota bacterium]